tara:strand:+ start:1132 stop:2238 length:1107 start_codon:yes stop_codon:yes gene_type:complete
MDTSDPDITFDREGVCSHCRTFDETTSKQWFPNEEGRLKLETTFERFRTEGRNKPYDCIIGLSGGVDSSYLALVLKKYDLSPLVVHVDAGWNSELAVHNIEQIVKYCGYELHTHVMDWEEVQDLQVAYLKSGVANQDVVQDHAFFASLYHFAVKNKVSNVISGGNIATESVFPSAWHHDAMDALNLHAIQRKFGTLPLKDYKTISFWQYYLYYPFIMKMKVFRPLNFMSYDKPKALLELKEKVGYKDYGRKHGESRFTKFFQNHYLPEKFGIDKRKIHLSSQILSGQITRGFAVEQLETPLYTDEELAEDFAFVAKKLQLTESELRELTNSPGISYKNYPNWDNRYRWLKKAQSIIEKLLGRKISNYG